MVAVRVIRQENQAFADQRRDDEGVVGVFAGATSGIGARTLERMVTMFRAPTYYVLGRASSDRFAVQRKALEALNHDCNIIYVETDVSLISGIDLACQEIVASANKVDFLYMSMGGLPLTGAEYTSEGLETCFTISYFSRARLLFNLLPLLNESGRPRVLSVLNGGMERRIDEQDVGLDKNWTLTRLVNHSTLLTSLTFDHIAAQNPNLTLIHNAPGLVESDNVRRLRAPPDASFFYRVYLGAVKAIIAVVRFFIGMRPAEAGERQAYHLTSAKYGPGSFRVGQSSDVVPDNDALRYYKAGGGWTETFWDFTVATWDKALSINKGN